MCIKNYAYVFRFFCYFFKISKPKIKINALKLYNNIWIILYEYIKSKEDIGLEKNSE